MTADVRQKRKENPPEQPAKSADIFFVFFLFWRQSCPNDLIRQVGPTATAWATFGAGPFFISTVASLAPVRKKVPTPQVRPLVRLMIDTLRYALVMFYYPQNQADSSTICCESPRRDFAKKNSSSLSKNCIESWKSFSESIAPSDVQSWGTSDVRGRFTIPVRIDGCSSGFKDSGCCHS